MMVIFWIFVPCSLVKFTGVSEVLAASITALMMEAASTSEIPINCYHTTWHKNPEPFILTTMRMQNLK
jgi:hypothetical protein